MLATFTSLRGWLGVVLIAIAGWGIYANYFAFISEYAVVSRMRFSLRAPISGYVAGSLRLGERLRGDQTVASLTDPTVDTTSLTQLRIRADELRADAVVLDRTVAELSDVIARFQGQDAMARALHDAHLTELIAESNSQAAAETATLGELNDRIRRNSALAEHGLVSKQSVEEAVHEREVASARADAALSRVRDWEGLLKNAGTVGAYDSTTLSGLHYSRERADDLRLKLLATKREVDAKRVLIHSVEAELASERGRIERLRYTDLRLSDSRVWASLAHAGDYVTRGQELAQLVDCTSAYVVAAISARHAANAAVGLRVEFTANGSRHKYFGQVVALRADADQILDLVPSVSSNAAGLATPGRPLHLVIIQLEPGPGAIDTDCQLGVLGKVRF